MQRSDMVMLKVGLVFAGGGGKGAYHIGVWKALREYGIERNIQAISGTSVGGLNAALFVQGDFRLAERTWLTISPEKILSVRSASLIESLQKVGIDVNSSIYKYANAIQGYGMFSRHGMVKLIKESLNLEAVSHSSIPLYVTCCQIGRLKPQYLKLNTVADKKIESLLLATSAIPGVFPPEKIDGKYFYDGGIPVVGDNIPIEPLYREGCNLIIVVPLNRSDIIGKERFPGVNIVEILPQEDQGNLFSGTLQFTASGAKRRIQQGYQDTIEILKPVLKGFISDVKLTQTAERILKDHQVFSNKHDEHNRRLYNQMESFEQKLQRGNRIEFNSIERNNKSGQKS